MLILSTYSVPIELLIWEMVVHLAHPISNILLSVVIYVLCWMLYKIKMIIILTGEVLSNASLMSLKLQDSMILLNLLTMELLENHIELHKPVCLLEPIIHKEWQLKSIICHRIKEDHKDNCLPSRVADLAKILQPMDAK